MPKPFNKKPTRIDDMPGLWDMVDDTNEDVMRITLERQRKAQTVPSHTLREDQIQAHVLKASVRPNELEFISFGSGSSGNCAYIGIRGLGGILIDAGVDADKVIAELERNFIPIDKISGIILTHDHSDHVRYAYKLVRKSNRLIYCTPRTLNGILRRHNISKRIKDYHKPIFKEFEFDAGPFKIIPFEVSHDGTDNVGFCIKTDDKCFVVATDMGVITERADYYMRLANYLMIESNYDKHMLDIGRYPDYLKRRISSERGHLNNVVTASYLADIWTQQLTNIYLCHLSEDNNTPEIAFQASYDALRRRNIKVGDGSGSSIALTCQVQLSPLPRYDSSPLYIHRL